MSISKTLKVKLIVKLAIDFFLLLLDKRSFDAFSKLCPAKYDYIENRKWWNKLEDIPKKPLTFATLIYMVKNDNNKIY